MASAATISSVKALAESNGLIPIPSSYHSFTENNREDVADELAASFPVIDFSLLTSQDPQVHANAVQELGKACKEWGFFMIINHGISESLMEDVVNKSLEFHNLPLEEKNEYSNEHLITSIRFGTSALPYGEDVHYWRDYLKVNTFPEFNFPSKPPGFQELAFVYTRKVRDVAKNLLQGISESLGLEPNALYESTGFDSGFQTCQVNLYPPCPQPDLVLGLIPHTDNGLLTLLTQNKTGGLQVKHDGKWVNVNPLPNCFIVNTGDQLEAASNGRYKSIWHRVVLNETDTRISFAVSNGPALDKEIGPAPELLEKEEAVYKTLTYKEYFQVQQKARCAGRRGLDLIRID